LFDKNKVMFSGGADVYNGCLSNSAKLRDYDPEKFLANLVWNTQGEHQCFQFGPADRQSIDWFIRSDSNATINVITGAWAVPLFHSKMNFPRIRRIAARYQATEAAHVARLRQNDSRARVRVWTLTEFVEDPMRILQTVLEGLGADGRRRVTEVPVMADLTGFGAFVQRLKNEGMNPHVVGKFPLGDLPSVRRHPAKPYVVR
ncbi:MAG: glycosyl transferase, partial [Paracoccaceae bacterium]